MVAFRRSASVVLTDDGSGVTGSGSLRIAPVARNWQIRSLTVRCDTHVKESRATVYENHIGPDYVLDASFTGSSGDTTDTVMEVRDGYALVVEWVGGDIGATATVTFSGEET